MTHMHRPMREIDRRASSPTQYWVVGGEFRDTEFTALEGTAEALGPFAQYVDAFKEWERRSVETKRHAHIRYTIVGSLPR